MKEMFDQTTKNMEQAWDMWQQMIAKGPWWQEPEGSFMKQWKSWVATTRSTFDTNMDVWKTFVEQSEDSFFKMFKQSPLYNENMESRMREVWDGLKKAQQSQQEIIKSQWEKMEELMKEAE
jgi:hypothetical protein